MVKTLTLTILSILSILLLSGCAGQPSLTGESRDDVDVNLNTDVFGFFKNASLVNINHSTNITIETMQKDSKFSFNKKENKCKD